MINPNYGKSLPFYVKNTSFLIRAFLLSLCVLILLGNVSIVQAQNTFYYTLNGTFNEATSSASPLIVRPNAAGQTGNFVTRSLPASTCGGIGVFDGYEYEPNASLEFRFPLGTAGCDWTIQFTWQYDNPIIPFSAPPRAEVEWIKIFSFAYTDDSGFNIRTEFPSLNGTLYYWHLSPFILGLCIPDFGVISPVDHFNTTDYYQMSFTRECNDVITAYANGVLLGSFIDSDQRYVPQPPLNRIMFFRDTIDLSCYPTAFPGEVSTGFVKDMVIADYPFSGADIAADFLTFCPAVLNFDWTEVKGSASKLGNEVSWAVNQPQTIQKFVIERSRSQLNFEEIGEIVPQSGGISADTRFTFIDPKGPEASFFYRIKAIGFDGSEYLSSSVEVLREFDFAVYPNPTKDHLWIELPGEGSKELEIQSSLGQSLVKIRLIPGRNWVPLANLPSGILLLKVENTAVKKILKIN